MKDIYLLPRLLLFQVLVVIGLVTMLELAPHPLHTNLIRWDAVWYLDIVRHGYIYSATAINSTAYFPLFPWLWRITHLGPIGISLVNLVVASGSLYLLWRGLRLRPIVLLLFAVFPSSMFLYLPYTEASFFFFSSLVVLFVAQRYQRPAGLAAALFGGALTRVAAVFYLPAFVVMEGMEWLQAPRTWWVRVRRLVGYGLVTGAGLVAVVVLQWYQTGVWFAFNKTQVHWDHRLRMPILPFTSNSQNDGSLWLDGLAVTMGFLCIGWLGWVAVRVVRRTGPPPDRLLVFAATYLAATVVQTLFNAPIEHNGCTSLLSMQRYVFCTPFFLVLLERLVPRQRLAWSTIGIGIGLLLLTAAMVGMFSARQFDIEWPLKPLRDMWRPVAGWAYAGFMLAYGFAWFQSGTRWGRVVVYVSSLGIQLFYLYSYTVGHWVG